MRNSYIEILSSLVCKLERLEYKEGETMVLSEYDERNSLRSEIECACAGEEQRVDRKNMSSVGGDGKATATATLAKDYLV